MLNAYHTPGGGYGAGRRLKTAFVAAILLLSFIPGSYAYEPPRAQADPLVRHRTKIAPALRDEVQLLNANPAYDYRIPVIARVREDFFLENQQVQGEDQPNALPLIKSYAARLTAREIRLLIESETIEYITPDAVIWSNSDLKVALQTTGTDQVQAAGPKPKFIEGGYSGQGVVVALFDSGISDHRDLRTERVITSIDFTSGEAVPDEGADSYGHGTAVAGIIGARAGHGSRYFGVAPDVQFVNIRVLDSEGRGHTSNLIKAIQWVIQNREAYKIRIANFSLGHPPFESYQTDPQCQAIEALFDAGVIPVASVGNLGQLEGYPRIWGAINSPANSPAAIGAYAINDNGTVTHADDQATSYGSRGPTYVDGLFKPDVSAPGHRITSLRLPKSKLGSNNQLRSDHHYMSLSGSSMATGFVSGLVALMLEANPELTPNLVKTILLVSAIKLESPHMLEQGNGLINGVVAVNLAREINPLTRTLNSPVAASWVMGKDKGAKPHPHTEVVWAGGAFAIDDRILYTSLVSSSGGLWGDGRNWSDVLNTDGHLNWSGDLFTGDNVIWSDRMIWSDSSLWSNSLADKLYSIIWSDSMIWSDSLLDKVYSIIWSDSLLYSDSLLDKVYSIIWSDSSPELKRIHPDKAVIWSDTKLSAPLR